MGNLKSVSELSRTYVEHFEFRVKRSHKYWGASSCRDLKTIILDSLAQIHEPMFARGPWPETLKASLSRTNQTTNKRRRQKKRVKIFRNFTYLHKTQPGQKTAGNFPNFFEDICSPDVWVSRFGCRLK